MLFALEAVCGRFPAILRLGVDGLAGSVGLMLLLRLFPDLIGVELAQLLHRIFDRIPPKIARHLAFLSRPGSI